MNKDNIYHGRSHYPKKNSSNYLAFLGRFNTGKVWLSGIWVAYLLS